MTPRWLDVDALTDFDFMTLRRAVDEEKRRLNTQEWSLLLGALLGQMAEHAAARPAPSIELTQLINECKNREEAARDEAADTRRYAAWQRSPEGQGKRDAWIGGPPEDADGDAAFQDREADFFAALLVRLNAVDCPAPSAAAIAAAVIAAARELVIAETAGLTSARQWDALCAALKQYDALGFGATEEAKP